MEYQIVNRGGHIEILDSTGRFICSADTVSEALREVEEMEKERKAG